MTWKPIFVAIDQLLNATLGALVRPLRTYGFGDEDETISSVLGKLERQGNRKARFVCWFLSLFERDHCQKAIEE